MKYWNKFVILCRSAGAWMFDTNLKCVNYKIHSTNWCLSLYNKLKCFFSTTEHGNLLRIMSCITLLRLTINKKECWENIIYSIDLSLPLRTPFSAIRSVTHSMVLPLNTSQNHLFYLTCVPKFCANDTEDWLHLFWT